MVNQVKGDTKAIFAVFIGAIIAVVFIGSVADSIFNQVNTFTLTNRTVEAPAINVSLAVPGRELITQTSIENVTDHKLVDLGLSLSEATVSGVKTVVLRLNDSASAIAGTDVNLTYTYGPDGYLERSADRSIVNLIIIFSVIAIMIFVVVVFIKEGSFGEFFRRR